MEYLRRYILSKSLLPDRGGRAEDERFPPAGDSHAKTMARHVTRLGVMTSSVELFECFGWDFTIRIQSVSFMFILQQYSDEWLVLCEWGLLRAIFHKRSVLTAIQLIEDATRIWQPQGAQTHKPPLPVSK